MDFVLMYCIWVINLAAAIWILVLVYEIIAWSHRIDDRFENVEKDLSEFRQEMREDREVAREDRKDWRQENQATTSRIDQTLSLLMSVQFPAPASAHTHKTTAGLLDNHSPLGLAEDGHQTAEVIQADKVADKCLEELRPRVAGQDPYGIQEMCFVYVRRDFKPDAELDRKIRAAAYEKAVGRDDVLDVLAIVLRDKLLAEKDQVERAGADG